MLRGGKVHQMSFRRGEPGGWGRHHHRQHQIAWVSQGVSTVVLDERRWVVTPTRAVWIPGGHAHDVVNRDDAVLHCLYVWPQAEVDRLTERLREAPVSNKATRDFVRMFSSASSDERPDKQGRITIPQHLRTYAGLERDCVVVGAINRVEIWDAVAWQRYEESKESAFADLDDEVFPGV